MKHYQLIFLIADPSMHYTPAFERAVWLARRSQADLHMAIFDHDIAIAAEALIDEEAARRDRQEWIDERLGWLSDESPGDRVDDVGVTTEVVWASPVQDAILSHVASHRSDLVIKDVHHESLLQRVLLKPLDWHLLRTCPVPLLLVHSSTDAAPWRVIAAIDASHAPTEEADLNDRIIKAARDLARECSAQLHMVFSCYGPGGMLGSQGSGLGAIGRLRDLLLPVQTQNFMKLADANEVPNDRRHFLYGLPAETLADFTRSNFNDALVIGAMRHTLMDRLLMGAAAEAILDRTTCNVLAVKL